MEKITFCIGTHNNLNYLKLAVKSVRENSFYKTAPFIIHAENCEDGTDEWLRENGKKYNLEYYIDKNEIPSGIGGGMNFCAEKTKTEFIMFLHADFYVAKNWDLELMKKFEKYPNQKMWAFSHRIQPNIFKENNRSGTIMVPLNEFGEYHHNFDETYFLEWAEEFSNLNDFEIEKTEGVSFKLYARSSTGSKTPLRLANNVGIIDKGYRGPLIACFDNLSEEDFLVEKNMRLVQICGSPLQDITFELVEELSDTTRGVGGFGSTGI